MDELEKKMQQTHDTLLEVSQRCLVFLPLAAVSPVLVEDLSAIANGIRDSLDGILHCMVLLEMHDAKERLQAWNEARDAVDGLARGLGLR